MFTETTRNIRVTAHPQFLAEQSSAAQEHYVWAYTIEVENRGQETVQLISRHWHIADARGQVQEVRGAGVIGEQPVLKPGEAFRYTSGTSLAAPSGLMHGEYEMQTAAGERFEIKVPAFSLDSPFQAVRAN
jgi:ApaG protein